MPTRTGYGTAVKLKKDDLYYFRKLKYHRTGDIQLKIAVSGKGGVGKTLVSGVLAGYFA